MLLLGWMHSGVRSLVCRQHYSVPWKWVSEHPAAQPAIARTECVALARAQANSLVGSVASLGGASDTHQVCNRPPSKMPPPRVGDACLWEVGVECKNLPSIWSFYTQCRSCHVHSRSPAAFRLQPVAQEPPLVRSQRACAGVPGPWTLSYEWGICWSCQSKWTYRMPLRPSWRRPCRRPDQLLPLARPWSNLRSPAHRWWRSKKRPATNHRFVTSRRSPRRRRRSSSACSSNPQPGGPATSRHGPGDSHALQSSVPSVLCAASVKIAGRVEGLTYSARPWRNILPPEGREVATAGRAWASA